MSITYSNAYYDSNTQRHILTTGSSNFGSMTINTQVPEAFVFNCKSYAFSNPFIEYSFGDTSNRYKTLITGSNIGISYNTSNLSQTNYTFPTGASNEVSLKYSLSNISVHINRSQVLSTTHSNCSFENSSYFQVSASNRSVNSSNSVYIQYPVVQPVIAVSPPTEFLGSVKVNGSLINSNLTIIGNQANFSSNVSAFSSNALSNYFLNTTGTTLSNYAYSNLNNRVTISTNTANWASNNIPSSSVYSSNTASWSSNALYNKAGGQISGNVSIGGSASKGRLTIINGGAGRQLVVDVRSNVAMDTDCPTIWASDSAVIWGGGHGHLILEGRANDGRHIVFCTGSNATERLRIQGNGDIIATNNITSPNITAISNTASWASNNIPSIAYSSNTSVYSSNTSSWSSNTVSYTSNNALINVGTGGLKSLLLTSGNVVDSYTYNQLEFGFLGTSTYRHAIKSRHNSASLSNNAIDFTLWANYQNSNTVGDSTAMSITPLGVGIGYGNRNPKYALQVYGKMMLTHTAIADDRNALILSEWTTTDSPQKNYSFGIYNGELTYQVPALNDSFGNVLSAHTFYSGNSSGNTELMRINWNNTVSIGNAGGKLYGLGVAAPSNTSPLIATFVDKDATTVLNITGYNTSQFNPNSAACILFVGRNTSTGRSINAGGQINAGGLDLCEYFTKKNDTFTIQKGDVCGIDENGKLTNKWSESIHFVIKTTNPAFSMGDGWGIMPERPTDSNLIPQWEAELESKRVLQDRIGIAGRCPLNYTGSFDVGDYVIPIKSGVDDIGVKVEKEQTISFKDYKSAVGRIVERLPDGRPFVLVKPV